MYAGCGWSSVAADCQSHTAAGSCGCVPSTATTIPLTTVPQTSSSCNYISTVSSGSNCVAFVPRGCSSGKIGWNYPNLQSNPGVCIFQFNPPSQCYKLVFNAKFDLTSASPLGYDGANNLNIRVATNGSSSLVRSTYVDGPFINVIATASGPQTYIEDVDFIIQAVGAFQMIIMGRGEVFSFFLRHL